MEIHVPIRIDDLLELLIKKYDIDYDTVIEESFSDGRHELAVTSMGRYPLKLIQVPRGTDISKLFRGLERRYFPSYRVATVVVELEETELEVNTGDRVVCCEEPLRFVWKELYPLENSVGVRGEIDSQEVTVSGGSLSIDDLPDRRELRDGNLDQVCRNHSTG